MRIISLDYIFQCSSFPDPGTCYVCNSCTLRDTGDDETCAGELPKRDPISSDCVETTAYTLLSLLEAKDDEKTACLAQWLLKQQNSYGSYGSSQVCDASLWHDFI